MLNVPPNIAHFPPILSPPPHKTNTKQINTPLSRSLHRGLLSKISTSLISPHALSTISVEASGRPLLFPEAVVESIRRTVEEAEEDQGYEGKLFLRFHLTFVM